MNAACLTAESRSDAHIGTEQLLIALAGTGPENPLNRGLDPNDLQADHRRRYRRFTSGAKGCLQQSLEIAAREGHCPIGLADQ